MFTRRTMMAMIIISAVFTLLLQSVHSARAQPVEKAVRFVESTINQLVVIINSRESLVDKRRRLQEVIAAAVDIDDIGPYCLGRFWSAASPDEREQYLDQFRRLLATKMVLHLGQYQGLQVAMGEARTEGNTEIVSTSVERPNLPVFKVDWVVASGAGVPKIVDLLTDRISLRATQSADFASYLAHHGNKVSELIEGMRQMAAQNGP